MVLWAAGCSTKEAHPSIPSASNSKLVRAALSCRRPEACDQQAMAAAAAAVAGGSLTMVGSARAGQVLVMGAGGATAGSGSTGQ